MSDYEKKPVSMGSARAKRLSDSGKALLVRIHEQREDVWIPVSQIHDDSEVWEEGHVGNLVVNEWFAEQRNWI